MAHDDHDHDHDHDHAHGPGHRHGPHDHSHDHSHDHHHDHDHSHGHHHSHSHHHHHDHAHGGNVDDTIHERPPVGRKELERGAGRGKVLFLDAPSGLAGDMIVAALVDLGVPEVVVANALSVLPLSGYSVHFGTRVRSGIVGTSFDVQPEPHQPTRNYRDIRAILDEAKLEDGVKRLAFATFQRLAEAESKVHRMPIDSVHFHEVGSVDAIVDVVSSSAALEYLGAELWVSPLPMGRGFVNAAHGVLPLPAPATVECLRGLETREANIDFEFVTPTGAAIVGAHAAGSSRWPAMAPECVGWGSGKADLKDRPNLLRAVLGGRAASGRSETTHALLEANIDDATGEIVGASLEAIFHAGAVDAWLVPITMKKGRPAWTLSALAPLGTVDDVTRAILRETTTLGVRRRDVSRSERPRRIVDVKTKFGIVPVKVADGDGLPARGKPEFEACRSLAKAHHVTVREVIETALSSWMNR